MNVCRMVATVVVGLVLSGCNGTAPQEEASADTAQIETDQDNAEIAPRWLGDWVGTDDPKSTLTITADTVAFVYDAAETEAGAYTIEQGCPSFPDLPFEDDTIVTGSGDDSYCYAIDTAEPDRLVLIYLPRGNALEYRRAQ